MLVIHEQLGIGKVINRAHPDQLVVAFLFFWPLVTLKHDQVKKYNPSPEFKYLTNAIIRMEIGGHGEATL